jgi:hypothetical protein
MNWMQILPLILAVISLVISVLSYLNSRNKNQLDFQFQEDKELSEYAISLLEGAYKVLTNNGENNSRPEASRLNWLTSARYILRFYTIKDTLKTNRYKLICRENEEQWRHEFYKVFRDSDFNSHGYFTGTQMYHSIENIEPRSAVVIAEFVHWSDNYEDLIDSFDYKQKIEEEPHILDGKIGLKIYLEKLDEERKKKSQPQT